MYRNLEAELRRKRITRAILAEALGINIATISEKLTKPHRLWLYEAVEIQEKFFPNMELSYLFRVEVTDN